MTVRTNVIMNTIKVIERKNLGTTVFLTTNLVSDFEFFLNKVQFDLI